MKRNCWGIAMIEVLLSMGIIAFVLLSLLVYQISMTKNTDKMNLQAIALLQLDNFAEMLLANQKNAYRKKLLTHWNKDNVHLLPQGWGNYRDNENHSCQISLQWFSGKIKIESMVVFC